VRETAPGEELTEHRGHAKHQDEAVGFQNSAIASEQQFQAVRSYSDHRARVEAGPAGVRTPRRTVLDKGARLQRAIGLPCVVVRHMLGKHPVKVSVAGDQHAVGEFGSGLNEMTVPACRGWHDRRRLS
jgi:hypothetical protein